MKKLIFLILLSSFISNRSICQQSHVNVDLVCSRLKNIQEINSCIELAAKLTNCEKTKYDGLSWQFAAELYYNLLKKHSDSLNLTLAELANLSFHAALNSLSLNIIQNKRTLADSIYSGKINEIIFGLHDRKIRFRQDIDFLITNLLLKLKTEPYFDTTSIKIIDALDKMYNQNTLTVFNGDFSIKSLTEYKNGKKNGSYKEYFDNGRIKISGQYKKDKMHGIWHEYDPSSMTSCILKQTNYKNGKQKN